MREFLRMLIWILLAAGSAPLQARAGYYCANPAAVARKAYDCTMNEHVSEAGVLCLNKLEAEIEAAKAAVGAAAAVNSAQSQASQRGKEANARADYNFSLATLNLLIANAEKAQLEVIYFDKRVLSLPEDWDEPEITGLTPEAYLKSVPCFNDNRKVLSDVLLDFDVYISDLKFARDSAQKLKQGTEQNMDSLDNGSLPGKVSAKAAAGAGTMKGSKPKNHGQTITGYEQDKAKRNKAQPK